MGQALYIGIMSGTSLDGIDVVLVDLASSQPSLLSHSYLPFPSELKNKLFALSHSGGEASISSCSITSIELCRLYAEGVFIALEKASINANQVIAIGCHGQTILHRPDIGFTVQLNNPAWLVELTNISVVADFRNRDIAAGGQGAPLVPAFHQAMFANADLDRVIVNIGGIANITYLPKTGDVIGFDCGPGNVLLDYWIHKHMTHAYDHLGSWAEQGQLVIELFNRFCQENYFSLPPPKSTGRELFNPGWLATFDLSSYFPIDIQRTLLELTVHGISTSILKHCEQVDEVFLCGGGAKNLTLINLLKNKLPNVAIHTTDALGIDISLVEAMAFAWLAQQTIIHKAGNIPTVTGAKHSVILGAIYPK